MDRGREEGERYLEDTGERDTWTILESGEILGRGETPEAQKLIDLDGNKVRSVIVTSSL